MAKVTICECGLAKCYHEGGDPLAYRNQDGKVLCKGYEPRRFGTSPKNELELYKLALEMAARDAVNSEGTFGEQMKRERQKESWLKQARESRRALEGKYASRFQ